MIALLSLLAAGVAALSPMPSRDAPLVLGLVVTSNRSLELGRPELAYADDDGARWADLLGALAAPGDVELLTAFDADSARLYPELVATVLEPTRANVEAATRRLTARATAARREGRVVELYVVYAGHGDVDRGRGFVSLADGPWTSDDLEALLRAIPATHAHVLLDSCNSFFLIQPRKPGGRRFATPKDAALRLERRLPHVGVFLSTSAEAEVYEWSELSSGIFSYAVRSGLAGGADADRDGRVTYDELDAFVGVASAEVKNPAFRPRVFARGPGGDGTATLARLDGGRGVRLALDPAAGARVTVRDAAGVPVVDVHQEPGAPVTLTLPARWTAGGVVEARAAAASSPRTRHGLGEPVAGDEVAVAALAVADAEAAGGLARGPGDLLRALFARPFGPAALVAWQATRDQAPPPVYGISRDDVARMELILGQIGAEQHAGRMRGALGLVGVGALMLGSSTLAFDPPDAEATGRSRQVGWGLVGVGAAAVVAGGLAFVLPGDAERLLDRFHGDLASTPDATLVVARTERRLDEIAADYRSNRKLMRIAGTVILGAGALGTLSNELGDDPRKEERRLYSGSMALMGGFLALFAMHPYPIEVLAEQWREDPGIKRLPRYVIAPVGVPGGFGAGVAGTF